MTAREQLTKEEHAHRLAYAERQFETFKLRAMQAQIQAQVEVLKGDAKAAERYLGYSGNHLRFVSECNDAIDMHRRALGDDSTGVR